MGKSPREPRWGVSRQGWPASASPPPTAEQQHLEEGQKFKQQVQNERADNQQRAAEAAKHKRKPGRPRKDAFGMHSILSKARTKQRTSAWTASGRRRGASRAGGPGGTQLSSVPSWRVDPCRCAGSNISWADSATSVGGEGEGGMG